MHWTLGSPIYPDGHVQTGSWLSTLQKALVAHGSVTAQGLRHFLLMQAVCSGHSELSRHSGASTGTREALELRDGDPARYLGKGGSFDRAIGDFAMRYADQAERDYEAFMAAAASGRIELDTSVNK